MQRNTKLNFMKGTEVKEKESGDITGGIAI
jgi:hypothetical protein